MSKTEQRNGRIKALAYAYRYAFPWLGILTPMVFLGVPGAGIGITGYGLYSLVGYLCRWKHIYCAYQNAYHQEMTPDNIRWETVKKTDALGIPAVLVGLGIAVILAHFLQW